VRNSSSPMLINESPTRESVQTERRIKGVRNPARKRVCENPT